MSARSGSTHRRSGPLPARALRVIRAVAEAQYAPEPSTAEARLDGLLDDLSDFLRKAGPKTTVAIRLAAAAIQLSPPLHGRFGRFTSLAPEARRQHLLAIERTALAKAYLGLKTLLCILWFEQPGDPDLPAKVAM